MPEIVYDLQRHALTRPNGELIAVFEPSVSAKECFKIAENEPTELLEEIEDMEFSYQVNQMEWEERHQRLQQKIWERYLETES